MSIANWFAIDWVCTTVDVCSFVFVHDGVRRSIRCVPLSAYDVGDRPIRKTVWVEHGEHGEHREMRTGRDEDMVRREHENGRKIIRLVLSGSEKC